MLLYTPILKIPHEYYVWKYPKLDEAIQVVYKNLYNKVLYREKHNALVDTYLTYKLFRWYPYIANPPIAGKYTRYYILSGMFRDYPNYNRFWKKWRKLV